MKNRLKMTVVLSAAFLCLALSLTILPGCSSPATPVPAQQPSTPPSPLAKTAPQNNYPTSYLNYLPSNAIAINAALPAPPATGSAEDIAELNYLLELQNTRTQADCDRANSESDPTFENFFGPAYGPLTADEVTALNPFFSKVQNDIKYFTGAEKNLWKRPRPYLESSAIHPCLPLESSYAYPSGHTSYAWTFAEVLSLISPENKAVFENRAAVVAQDRVMGGVHHPSDIVAGKELAEEIVQALESSPEFQQDLNTIIHSLPKK